MRPEVVATTRDFPSCRRTSTGAAARAMVVAAALLGCNGKIGGSGGGSTTLPPGLAGPINPGRVVAHRLNNVEYNNTVRDLTGQDTRPSVAFGFPDDTYIEGFDNNADALAAPPLLLEKLETATAAIVAGALDPAPANAPVRGRIMTCDPAKSCEATSATE